jgi:endogenous inhibitor of DNA gyrase (YacG/DUF329 family)
MKFNCCLCKKDFKGKPSMQRKFCSRECWRKFGEQKRTYECTECKIIFQIPLEGKPKPGRPFCSKKCWDVYQVGENNPSWKGVKESRKCIVCCNVFLVEETRRKNVSRYCSFKCRSIDYKIKGNPLDHNLFDKCNFCKKEIKITKRKLNKRNFCSRNCASLAHSAYIASVNNGRYIHGDHASSYPLEWNKRFKEKIRERDSHQCMLCALPQEQHNTKLNVHHIDYVKENLSANNLITLCKYCHGKMHGNLESRILWKEKLSKLLEK